MTDSNNTTENKLLSIFTSVKITSGGDYLLPNVTDLHNRIEEVMQLEPYHPKYLLWRVFLYRYFYSNCDITATSKFAERFLSKDRTSYIIPANETSKTIDSYISSTRTIRKTIFNGITAFDFSKVMQAADVFLNNKKVLLKIIESNEEFKAEVQNVINKNTFHSIYIAYFLKAYRWRYFDYWNENLAQSLLPKWVQWCDTFQQCFLELQSLLGDRVSLYAYYNEDCKAIHFRLLDYSIEFLTSREIKNVAEIYGTEFDKSDTLSKDFIIDFVGSFPLYNSITFDLYHTWNMLYAFYFGENQTILDYYRLFLINKRLYNKNLKAIEDLNDYLCHNDIGLECVSLKKIELFNAGTDPDEADYILQEYFDDLVSRGIVVPNRREEILYAIRQTY